MDDFNKDIENYCDDLINKFVEERKDEEFTKDELSALRERIKNFLSWDPYDEDM